MILPETLDHKSSVRQCGICKCENISQARFCGHCGAVLSCKNVSGSNTKNRIFYGVLALAGFLLAMSIVFAGLMPGRNGPVRTSSLPFKDVALDHPVYQMCRNLLQLKAIGFRKNLQLAPYDGISASEWNHVLYAVGNYLNITFPATAFFKSGTSVNNKELQKRFSLLGADFHKCAGVSRISVFYLLEQALFNHRTML